MIKLGDKVKDTTSGLVGIVVSKTEYLNGCIQFAVQPPYKKGATEIPVWNVDERILIIVKKKVSIVKKKRTGGLTRKIKGT